MSRFLSSLLLAVVLPVLLARAQVGLTFKLDYNEVLELESIPAVVTLENLTSVPLQGETDYLLSFEVTDASGIRAKPRNGVEVNLPTELAPGTSRSITNDLNYLYRIDGHGQYGVVARLRLKSRELASERVFLDVVPGVELVHAEGSAPDGQERRYSLRQMSRNRQNHLYVRIDDPTAGLNYGIFDLGRFVPLKKPELQVDQRDLAHVLHMTSPNQFVHSVFAPSGDLVAQQSHVGDASIVRLQADEEAGYRVVGVGLSAPRDPFIETLPGRRHL
jgi:hypothetical protein